MFKKMIAALTRNADHYLAAMAPEAASHDPELFVKAERLRSRMI